MSCINNKKIKAGIYLTYLLFLALANKIDALGMLLSAVLLLVIFKAADGYTLKMNIKGILPGLFMSVLTSVGLSVNSGHVLESLGLFGVLSILGTMVFNDFLTFLSVQDGENKVISYRTFVKYFGLFLGISFVYYMAYYPGIMVPDSADQWSQVIGIKQLNDWHPVGHTAVIWFTHLIYDSPASFILLQMAAYASVLGYGFYLTEKYFVSQNVRRWLIALFTISPYFAMLSVTVIKDALFSYMLLLFILVSVDVYLEKKINTFKALLLMVSVLGVLFFRHNGFPIIIISEISFGILFFRRKFWRLHVAIILSVVGFLLITRPVYKALHVIPANSNESVGMFIQMDASVLSKNDAQLSKKQADYFENLMPRNQIIKLYNPYSPDSIKFNGFKYDQNQLRFISNSVKLYVNNPKPAVLAYLKQTNIMWKIDGVVGMRPIFRQPQMTAFDYKKYKNEWSIDILRKILVKYQGYFLNGKLNNIFMPALYLFIIMGLLVRMLLNKEYGKILILTPFWANLAIVMIAIPAQDIRYLVMNYFVLIPVLVLFVQTQRSSSTADS